jgi:predicted porin
MEIETMKKSLFAIAAVGAFAGAAQAQSSVTVYGILDVGFQGVTTRAPYSSNNLSQVKSNATRFTGEGSETTSRLGFRGTEDLGGGTSAFFTVEFQLSPTDQTLSGNNGNGLFNRQSFVGLAKKGIGQAAIGTQYTPVHLAVARTDPGQANNMLGNVIYAVNASTGSGQTAVSYTVRYNNALTFQTDRFAGIQVNGIYVNNNATSNAFSAQTINGTAYGAANAISTINNGAGGLGLNFNGVKNLNVDLAYQKSMQKTVAGGYYGLVATPASATAGAVNAVNNFLGSNLNMTQYYGGATYNFGILTAYAQYLSAKYESANNTGVFYQRTAQQLGVRGNLTKTIEGWASAGSGKYNAALGNSLVATGNQVANFTGYQVGANYWLSKRTNLYGIFGSTQVSSTSVNASEGGSSYGVGVRHTF